MNKDVVLGFLGGLLIGAIGAGVWTSKRFEKELNNFCEEYDGYLDQLQDKWDKRCEACQYNHDIVDDEDIDEEEAKALVEQLNMMASLDSDDEEESDEEDEEEEDPYPDFEHDTYSETVQKMKDKNGIVDYTQFAQKKNKKEDEASAEDDKHEEVERVQDDYLDEEETDELIIKFIDASEYGDQEDYDQMELTYLEGSDVFLTEEDIKYDAWEAIGGKQNFKEGLEESGTGVVYVRNVALEMDFCITSDIRTYDEYIEETSSN